jgi:hypothetical protein
VAIAAATRPAAVRDRRIGGIILNILGLLRVMTGPSARHRSAHRTTVADEAARHYRIFDISTRPA